MIGQLSITTGGRVADKVQIAIDRLKAFEPPEGYYLAFSGGKDSQCIHLLCKLGGIKFDAHYAITSVDPPELVHGAKDLALVSTSRHGSEARASTRKTGKRRMHDRTRLYRTDP